MSVGGLRLVAVYQPVWMTDDVGLDLALLKGHGETAGYV